MPKGIATNPTGKNGNGKGGGYHKRIQADEEKLMFEFYVQCNKNISETADKFNRSWKTVKRLSIVNNWAGKSALVRANHTRAVANEYAKQGASDLQIIQGAITKVARELLEGKTTKSPTFSDLVNLMRLKLELKGELPLNNDGVSGNSYYNVVVNNFTPKQQQQINRNLESIFGRMGEDSGL